MGDTPLHINKNFSHLATSFLATHFNSQSATMPEPVIRRGTPTKSVQTTRSAHSYASTHSAPNTMTRTWNAAPTSSPSRIPANAAVGASGGGGRTTAHFNATRSREVRSSEWVHLCWFGCESSSIQRCCLGRRGSMTSHVCFVLMFALSLTSMYACPSCTPLYGWCCCLSDPPLEHRRLTLSLWIQVVREGERPVLPRRR